MQAEGKASGRLFFPRLNAGAKEKQGLPCPLSLIFHRPSRLGMPSHPPGMVFLVASLHQAQQ